MTHEIYHLITDESDQYLNTIEEVRNALAAKQKDSGSNIKIFKMIAEESEDDEILLSEIDVPTEDILLK